MIAASNARMHQSTLRRPIEWNKLGTKTLAAACIACTLLGTTPAARAGEPQPRKATTSREARDEAIRSIPLSQMTASDRAKVEPLLSKSSIFRRLPIQVIDCETDLYEFLVRNPEVVVNIWQVMGISKVSMQRKDSRSYIADDGAGTTGTIEYLYSQGDTHVIYTEGVYDGPMFHRPIRGRCIIVLKSGHIREVNGRQYVTSRVDTFLQFDNGGLELLARTFQSLVGKLADHNFAETSSFLSSLSRTAEINGAGVQRLAAKLTAVEPSTRTRFAELAGEVEDKLLATEDLDSPHTARVAEPAVYRR